MTSGPPLLYTCGMRGYAGAADTGILSHIPHRCALVRDDICVVSVGDAGEALEASPLHGGEVNPC